METGSANSSSPVFESLTHFERLQQKHRQALYEENREWAEAIEDEMKWRSADDTGVAQDYAHAAPVYFNTGCCCFADGDITGIEIEGGFIRLVKWKSQARQGKRIVLEERRLQELVNRIQSAPAPADKNV